MSASKKKPQIFKIENDRPGYVAYVANEELFELPDKYEINSIIGAGAYGLVCSGINKETGERVAIKKVPGIFSEHDAEFQKRILRELQVLAHFANHENNSQPLLNTHNQIICLKEIVIPGKPHDFEDVYIVTDLMDTDLRHIIRSDQPLSPRHQQFIMYQILRGLKYIHSADVLHRDLKPGNILIDANCELKICDFGLSRGVNFDVNPNLSTSYVVTRWYRAPELLLQYDKATKAIDMWSVGCIFAEILTRKVLFSGKNYLHQLDLILNVIGTPPEEDINGTPNAKRYMKTLPRRKPKPWHEVVPTTDAVALDLLSKLLVWNLDKRLTVEEALAHPYFADLHDESDEPTCAKLDCSLEQKIAQYGVRALMYEMAIRFNSLAAEMTQNANCNDH